MQFFSKPSERYLRNLFIKLWMSVCMVLGFLPLQTLGQFLSLPSIALNLPLSVEVANRSFSWAEERNPLTGDLEKVNVFGPVFESDLSRETRITAMRPFGCTFFEDAPRRTETYIFYPLFSAKRNPQWLDFNVFNLICYERKEIDDNRYATRTRFFPFYFDKSTGNPKTSYNGVFPLGGSISHILGMNQASWVFFPLYGKADMKTHTTYTVLWPFFKKQSGPNTHGFGIWPFAGHFQGEGRYDNKYLFWPLIYHYKDALHKSTPHVQRGLLPLYAAEDGENLKSRTYIWPFFGYTDKTSPEFSERRYFWPFLVQGRGEKYINRWAPIYSHSIQNGFDKHWVLWPIGRTLDWQDGDLNIRQIQILYFFFWAQKQTSIQNPDLPAASKIHVWPFWSYWDSGAGKKQLQLFSPLEVFFQNNKVIRELYSPIFAIFRYNQTAPGHSHMRIFFQFIKLDRYPDAYILKLGPFVQSESFPDKRTFSILHGLMGWKQVGDERIIRFLWMDFKESDRHKRARLSRSKMIKDDADSIENTRVNW